MRTISPLLSYHCLPVPQGTGESFSWVTHNSSVINCMVNLQLFGFGESFICWLTHNSSFATVYPELQLLYFGER